MFGNMMIKPLLISNLIEHASLYHGDRKIFSKNLDDSMVETSWFEISENSKKYANVLKSLKMEKGDRIATIAWNNHRHIEAWYAISGSGMVCHTINPRLFPDQLIFIINDANDKILMFDKTFAALIAKIKPHIKNVDFFICMDSFDPEIKEILPQVKFYDDLIRTQSSVFEWPQFDENTASSLCYTSGTTGNPKGVLYSHR